MAPKRSRKVVDEDDEMEMDMEEEEEESAKLFPELSDNAVEGELELPSLLSGLPKRKKRELLEFKRSHTEVRWLLRPFLSASHSLMHIRSPPHPAPTPSHHKTTV